MNLNKSYDVAGNKVLSEGVTQDEVKSLRLEDLDEEPGVTMSDLYDIVVRLERKVDMLGKQSGTFTTLEGVAE
jgi:hypothetical protein